MRLKRLLLGAAPLLTCLNQALPAAAAPWVAPRCEHLAPRFERTASPEQLAWKMPLPLPSFTRNNRGHQGDPVNLLLKATETELRAMFGTSGWVGADSVSVPSLVRVLGVLLDANQSYPMAPMSDLYLFGRRQDISYQKNNCNGRARDHLRIWQAPGSAPDGRPWWAIAATRDIDIKWADGLPTHRIAPDIDAERLLVARDLLGTSRVARTCLVNAVEGGFHSVNGEHDAYYTDGDVQVLEAAGDVSERAVEL